MEEKMKDVYYFIVGLKWMTKQNALNVKKIKEKRKKDSHELHILVIGYSQTKPLK